VILAGISGTGKSKLPQLVAEGTGAEAIIVPVRPDWTDSSDLLGFERLTGEFVPGRLLTACREAMAHPDTEYFFILDEMNIARVEYYFAEVLSLMENRRLGADGTIVTPPLLETAPEEWASVVLPSNLALIGTVNMDESTQGFSRKVLDRAFVIELADVDLDLAPELRDRPAGSWSTEVWKAPYLRLGDTDVTAARTVKQVVTALTAVNEVLALAQLQVGYRIRDEMALFCFNAQECLQYFSTSAQEIVSPLDLSLSMKILPRIQGGGGLIRRILEELGSWADNPQSESATSEVAGAAFPMTSMRVTMMAERLHHTGFTSFWL